MNDQPIRIRPLRDPVIKLKRTHPDAVLPTANNKEPGAGDTGFDLVAIEDMFVPPSSSAVVGVGLTLADISPGYWIRIEPRSGLGFKHNIQPHLGVIDNGYRGDLGVKLYNFTTSGDGYHVHKGDKIAQLVVYPLIQPIFEFTEQITDTARGDKGFGSSDNNNSLGLPPYSKRVWDRRDYPSSVATEQWIEENSYQIDQGSKVMPVFDSAEDLMNYAKQTDMPDDLFRYYLGIKIWEKK
jgi:dUTP pyrophosphatase